MVQTTIDSIVMNFLAKRGLPLHWYVEALVSALEILNEISYDTKGMVANVTSIRLTVDAYNEVALPSDFVDLVRIGCQNGRYITPLAENENINRLTNTEDGSQVAYAANDKGAVNSEASLANYYHIQGINQYAEHLGKMYGLSSTNRGDVFKVIPERNKIALGGSIVEGTEIYLEYISYNSSSATALVHKYAEMTIQTYIYYMFSQRYPKLFGPEEIRRRDHIIEKKKMRGRAYSMDIETIGRIRRGGFHSSIKV